MFAITGNDLTPAKSYEEAVALFEEKSKTQKSIADNEYLLGRPRDHSKRIRRLDDDVIFRFHQTDLVVWKSPTQVVIEPYDSRSSCVFVDYYAPRGIHMRSVRGKATVVTAKGQFEPKRDYIPFNKVGGIWTPDPDFVRPQTQRYLNKSKAHEVREQLKPWLDWQNAICRLAGKKPEAWYVGDGFRKDVLRNIDEAYSASLALKYNAPAEALLLTAYGYFGAIEEKPLPFGKLRKTTQYDVVHLS